MPTQLWGGNNEVQQAINAARLAHTNGQTKQVEIDGAMVEIPSPFPSPVDWRDSWIYFLLVDRFNNPNAAPRVMPFYKQTATFQGGTIEGVRQQLPYLQQLGVGALWLAPVLKNCQYSQDSYHGYGIQDFLNLDPRFASDPSHPDAELRRLIDEAHARKMYVIFDVVLNHAGDVFGYKNSTSTPNHSPTPLPIEWRDEFGKARPDWPELPQNGAIHPDAGVWPQELQRNDLFRRRGKSIKESNESDVGDFFDSRELVTEAKSAAETAAADDLLDILIRIHQYLIAAYDLDGFRIDTLKHLGDECIRQFSNAMREFAASIGKVNFFVFGEAFTTDETLLTHFLGNKTIEQVGVDALLDFPLANRLTDMIKSRTIGPRTVAAMFQERKQQHSLIISSHAEASRYFVTFLDNHDWRYRGQHERFLAKDKDHPVDGITRQHQLTLGLACLFTLQGIPCVYYGTEQGLYGSGQKDTAIREALWGKSNPFDENHQLYQGLQQIARIRRDSAVIRYGRQYFRQTSSDGATFAIATSPNSQFAFSRILADQELLVVANISDDPWSGYVLVDSSLNAEGTSFQIIYSNRPGADSTSITVQRRDGVSIQHNTDGSWADDTIHVVKVVLQPMEVQIVGPPPSQL